MASSPTSMASGTASPSSSANGMATSTTNPGQDLSIKYHKLATEYAKLRSQFGVVKKVSGRAFGL